MTRDIEALRGGTLYIDCFAGIAGDMMLGALLDLGVPEAAVREPLSRLPLSGWGLRVERVRRGLIMGTKIHVDVDGQGHGHGHGQEHERGHDHAHDHDHDHAHDHAHDHPHDHPHDHAHSHVADAAGVRHRPGHGHGPGDHPHVHYADIRRMIQHAGLPADVTARATAIFDRIAIVEAEMHGLPVDQVSFHEVGAVDSIIDIVGTAAALSWLRPRRVVARVVPLGGGVVKTAHGLLPVPAPATLALLRGAPVEHGGVDVELTTPTGAGILAATVERYGPMPPLLVHGTGFGAGDRELAGRPNLLRLVCGAEVGAEAERGGGLGGAERCVVIEANLDDMNPELCEPLLQALQEAGARDVWLAPVHMKKNRAGLVASALCDPDRHEAVTLAMLRESTTLGVRSYAVERATLDREQVQVQTRFGPVLVKVGRRHGAVWNVAPEYESCRAVAKERGVAVKLVYAAALAAFEQGRELT